MSAETSPRLKQWRSANCPIAKPDLSSVLCSGSVRAIILFYFLTAEARTVAVRDIRTGSRLARQAALVHWHLDEDADAGGRAAREERAELKLRQIVWQPADADNPPICLTMNATERAQSAS
jgi:hypothetical protein